MRHLRSVDFLALARKSKNYAFEVVFANALLTLWQVHFEPPCMPRGQREQAYVHIYIIDSRIKYMTYSTNKYKGEKIEVMDMDSPR